VLAVLAAAVVGVAGWVAWPRLAPAPARAAVRTGREYLDASACLLTGPGSVAAGAAGAPVWAAMSSVSVVTRVMVSYLPDTGPSDAGVMLNTLVLRRCGVIITTGTAVGLVARVARADPGQRFLVVSAAGGAGSGVPANVSVVSPAGAAAAAGQAVHALAAQSLSLFLESS
jgi:hypothetical protein